MDLEGILSFQLKFNRTRKRKTTANISGFRLVKLEVDPLFERSKGWNHFPDIRKTIQMPKGAEKEIDEIFLSTMVFNFKKRLTRDVDVIAVMC